MLGKGGLAWEGLWDVTHLGGGLVKWTAANNRSKQNLCIPRKPIVCLSVCVCKQKKGNKQARKPIPLSVSLSQTHTHTLPPPFLSLSAPLFLSSQLTLETLARDIRGLQTKKMNKQQEQAANRSRSGHTEQQQ